MVHQHLVQPVLHQGQGRTESRRREGSGPDDPARPGPALQHQRVVQFQQELAQKPQIHRLGELYEQKNVPGGVRHQLRLDLLHLENRRSHSFEHARTGYLPGRRYENHEHPRCRQERQSLAPAVGLYGHIQPVRQGAQHLRAAVGQFRRRPGTHSPPADHRRRVPRHGQPGRRQGLRSGDSAAPLGQHQLHHPARTRFQRRAVHAPVQPLRRGVFLDGHPAPQAGNRRRRPL